MDYLDRQKELRHRIILFVGYICIAVAITVGTIVLVYQAYGFGLKNGAVIQSGLSFFSSHPSGATINFNGKPSKSKTNVRMLLPEGIYHVSLTRSGYRDWRRTIEVDGSSVHHFDYPFLLPKTLTTKPIGDPYDSTPSLMTQSPDRRWLLIAQPGAITSFKIYDLKNPTKAPESLDLPTTLLTKATSSESWQLDDWADDNQHVLLQHLYDGKQEYILVDRTAAGQSLNLNTTLSANPTKLTLLNKKFDQYYLYDASTASLLSASLKTTTPTVVKQHVLAYQSYATDTLLYVTDSGAPVGKVLLKLDVGSQSSSLRSLPAGSTYLVDLTKYSGTLYVAAGASSDNKVYIYRDPLAQLAAQPIHTLVPAQVLHVSQPNYLSFSNSAQFIVVENGQQFGTYDIENKRGYSYTTTAPLDAPQSHVSWMDGDRLVYVSNGKLQMVDYDNNNPQTVMPASSSYLPAFAPDFKYVYDLGPSLAPDATPSQLELTQTALLLPADL